MKEYIDREAALDTLAKDDWKRTDEEKVAVLNCYDRIKKIPAADVVKERHGQWVHAEDAWGKVKILCSECRQGLANVVFTRKGEAYQIGGNDANYCPNCGAKMDGGDHDAKS